MTINDQIRDIIRDAAKISALSSGEIHKYEYLTGEDILSSNQKQIIEQTKFTYSPLGKAFEKQINTTDNQGKNQVDVLKDLKDHKKNQLMLMLVMIMRINYYIQDNEKYLEISIAKSLMKQVN